MSFTDQIKRRVIVKSNMKRYWPMPVTLESKGKIGQPKVKRYRPGVAPTPAVEDEEEEQQEQRDIRAEDVIMVSKDKDDPRLRRLAGNMIDNREGIRADRRRIRQKAEIVSTEEASKSQNDEDEEAFEERRRKIREACLRQEEAAEAELSKSDSEEESESECETDSEEDMMVIAMVKPVFVPKTERDTIEERERLEAEERAVQEAIKKRMEERKVETKEIVVSEIRKDEEIHKNMELEANAADVDTDDDVNEAEEYQAWTGREMARIKRGREERDAVIKEKGEIERVRNMTEVERRDWKMKNPKPAGRPKKKWKFMQVYYHKGAFFQSGLDDHSAEPGCDDIYSRDFSEPTGEDKMDKTLLPKIMQVKHFGHRKRTKWTHLANEDTSDRSKVF